MGKFVTLLPIYVYFVTRGVNFDRLMTLLTVFGFGDGRAADTAVFEHFQYVTACSQVHLFEGLRRETAFIRRFPVCVLLALAVARSERVKNGLLVEFEGGALSEGGRSTYDVQKKRRDENVQDTARYD